MLILIYVLFVSIFEANGNESATSSTHTTKKLFENFINSLDNSDLVESYYQMVR